MNETERSDLATDANLTLQHFAETHGLTVSENDLDDLAWIVAKRLVPVTEEHPTSTCRHCDRTIVNDPKDGWVDPEATGDDSVWRETCDAHDTRVAEHEPTEKGAS